MRCPQCQTDISDDSRFCSKCGTPVGADERIAFSQTRTILRPMEELSPETLLEGKYRVLKVVGRGGMGIVYMAEDTKLKRHVALKFLPPELVLSPEARERFVLEARAAAALSHPNMCTIYEIHDEGEKPFIAMEYIEGQSLKAKMAKSPLSLEDALGLAIQVSEGLEEAHGKGIIHRDIKSANIMVTDKGQAKIMDFGLAKVKGGTLLTREGTTLGTVAYMSPEQALGKDLDQRTDLWSLGVVLYEMLSGRLPFTGDHEASILYTVVHEEPKPLKALKPGVALELQQVVNRALKKNPEARYSSAAEMGKDIRKYRESLRSEETKAFSLRALLRLLRKPILAIPAALGLIAIILAAAWFLNRQAKTRWAKEQALPQIERLIGEGRFMKEVEAYRLAEKAEKYIPDDPKLSELLPKCSISMTIKTEPPGAQVYMKDYKALDEEWQYLGLSPLQDIRVPLGIFRWRMEKEGFETAMAVSTSYDFDLSKRPPLIPATLERALDKKESNPPGMVRVRATETERDQFNSFFIDQYEVTNRQYKEFMDKGGYRNMKFWKHEFIKEGRTLSWEEAITEFVDQSGLPGPATWLAGDFPDGQEGYPVSGISWYEAVAYAEFAGKSLPTTSHWSIASGEYTTLNQAKVFSAYLSPLSNFFGKGISPVGQHSGVTAYGAFDMAGNVREWCWNEAPQGRVIRGGAWNDATYMFVNTSQAPAFDRSPKNGFRCALYIDPEKISPQAFQSVSVREERDFYKEGAIPDSVFQVYKDQFSYDKKDLEARVEERIEDSENWIHEKISFDAAYGGERVIAHLFLPQNVPPPYQTVIYFPGLGSVHQTSSEDLENYTEFEARLSYIIKNRRAVLYPVYKGTFERGNIELASIHAGEATHQYTEYLVQLVKDFKRCIDYLETRPDIDSQKLAYLGFSWGGRLGPVIAAVEERIKTSILVVGGMRGEGRLEANPVNYVRRIKIPVLMLNGRYDMTFPYETTVKPMFDLLGTPAEHKMLKLYRLSTRCLNYTSMTISSP